MVGVVRVRGVHPPGVNAHIVKAEEVVPVYVAGLRAVYVVAYYSGGVVPARRPGGEAAGGPGLEVKQQTFLLELAVRLCHGAERLPDGNGHVGVHLVNLVHHVLRPWEQFVQELHCVPGIIGAPVLPVLDNSVQRHSCSAVSLDHVKQFRLALVALAALMVTVSPQRHHWNLAGKGANCGYHTVGIPAIDEVVVNVFRYL